MKVSNDSSSTYTNAAYSNKGMSGLMSGLDTESLVESMLSGIQAKIDKQNQAQQRLEWKQEQYRSVIKDINEFQNKYFNLTSDSCLRLSGLYDTVKTSCSSSAISVTAGKNAIDSDFSMQVARLATASSVTSAKLTSGGISTVDSRASSFEFSRTVDIKIGDGEAVTVDFKGADTAEEICSRINTAAGADFASVKYESKTVYLDDSGNELTYDEKTDKYTDADGNEYTGNVTNEDRDVAVGIDFKADSSFEISGTSAGLAIIGLTSKVTASAEKDEDGNEIENSFKYETSSVNTQFANTGKVGGSVDVTVDGVKKSISVSEGESMDDFRTKLQKAFGKSVDITQESDGSYKISVEGAGRKISLSANAETMEAIGFGKGTTNVASQVVATDTVSKLGVTTAVDAEGNEINNKFSINGVEIEYSSKDSISSIMSKINSSDAGVKMTYDDLSATFKISSTSTGEGYGIEIDGDDEGLFSKLGFNVDGAGSLDQSSVKNGQNAVVSINGVMIERTNNNFTYNGMDISLKTTTGSYETDSMGNFVTNADGTIKTAAGTTELKAEVSTARDVDKIVDTIKSFVEDYNSMIEKLNGYTHEKATYKEYAPLTEAQKKEMTEKEIELWEEKAKEGLLRSDTNVNRFLSDMRTAMYTRGDSKYVLSNIGINTSSEWTDFGKLTIDEDALKNALTKDPDGVKSLFVGDNGLATRLNNICSKTANTSSGNPGTLVQMAGVEGKATENENTISDELDSIAEKLERLNRTYETRKERYWSQFNAMETALANMNSQSMFLSQMLGG